MDLQQSPRPVPGVIVSADGARLLVPPLKVGDRKRAKRSGVLAKIAAHANSELPKGEDAEDEMCDLIHTALVRNYPALTREDMDTLVDARNLGEFMTAIMGQGDAVSSGEAESPAAP